MHIWLYKTELHFVPFSSITELYFYLLEFDSQKNYLKACLASSSVPIIVRQL